MGIDITVLRAINFAMRVAALKFDRTIMLGRQEIFFTKEDFEFTKRRAKFQCNYDESLKIGEFSEALFKKFGAVQVESIDASDYEGASIIANFNRPLSPKLCGRFTCFADFGSIEHIFNIPQVIANISNLLIKGGGVLIQSHANGYAGHGFYQFSPELFYSAFSEENGFTGTMVFLVDIQDIARWHFVPDPRLLKKRNAITQRRAYYIFCISTKCATPTEFMVQQSDYECDAWHTKGHSHMREYRRSIFSKLRHLINPFVFQNVRGRYYALLSHRKFRSETRLFDPDLISLRALDSLKNT